MFRETVAGHVAEPPGPVTVPVNVVPAVIAGVVVEPPATGVASPIPLSIESAVAFAVVQVRVAVPPESTLVGLAERVHAGAEGAAVTVTGAEHVTVPPAPVAVPVKVVLAVIAGVVVEPAPTGVTEPTPWLIENVFAFEVVQERMEVPPELTLVGLAESAHVGAAGGGGGGAEVTVTVTVQFTEPPEPVAVPVYVVVFEGETEREPAKTGVTAPMPWLMEKEVAFSVVQIRNVEEPLWIVVAEAVRVQTGAEGGGGVAVTVTVAVQLTVPPMPVAVPV